MAARRPFRFGTACFDTLSGAAYVAFARRIEDLGYDILVHPDHLNEQLAPIPALMAAADATRRLRVGSCVFANDFWHPVVLAKQAATLDVLSGGRFEFGLGAGYLPSDQTSPRHGLHIWGIILANASGLEARPVVW